MNAIIKVCSLNNGLTKFFLFLLTLLGISASAYGQDYTELPSYTLKSPEVQGIEEYGKYRVNEYTGTPSITIPLYTIQEGDLILPISLNYQASGIKVAQEATWAGLGWNLLAGGCISLIPVGQIDDVIPDINDAEGWSKLFNYNPSGYHPHGYPKRFKEPGWNLWSCTPKEATAISDEMLNNSFFGSGERDVYSANFLDYSFKFSLHPITREPVFVGERNNFKIVRSGFNWILTDETGVKYSFEAREIAEISTPLIQNSYTSTWYLTKIETMGRTLTINYQSVSNVELLPAISESVSYGYQSFAFEYAELGLWTRSTHVNKLNQQLYISSIETDNYLVEFTTKSRVDIRKALALDQITVKEKANNAVVKRVRFTHDYFTGTNVGTEASTADHIVKRLKLMQIHETDGSKNTHKHTFAYNETIALPYKNSFAQDYWGYYNGEENKVNGQVRWAPQAASEELYPSNRSLIPKYFELLLNNQYEYERIMGITNAIHISMTMRDA